MWSQDAHLRQKTTNSQGNAQVTGSFSGVSTKADLIRGLSAVIVRCTSIPAPIPPCSAFAGGLAEAPLAAVAVLAVLALLGALTLRLLSRQVLFKVVEAVHVEWCLKTMDWLRIPG